MNISKKLIIIIAIVLIVTITLLCIGSWNKSDFRGTDFLPIKEDYLTLSNGKSVDALTMSEDYVHYYFENTKDYIYDDDRYLLEESKWYPTDFGGLSNFYDKCSPEAKAEIDSYYQNQYVGYDIKEEIQAVLKNNKYKRISKKTDEIFANENHLYYASIVTRMYKNGNNSNYVFDDLQEINAFNMQTGEMINSADVLIEDKAKIADILYENADDITFWEQSEYSGYGMKVVDERAEFDSYMDLYLDNVLMGYDSLTRLVNNKQAFAVFEFKKETNGKEYVCALVIPMENLAEIFKEGYAPILTEWDLK